MNNTLSLKPKKISQNLFAGKIKSTYSYSSKKIAAPMSSSTENNISSIIFKADRDYRSSFNAFALR